MIINDSYDDFYSFLSEQGRGADRHLFADFKGDEHDYYEKTGFSSLADIPEDMSGFVYPKFEELSFYLPEKFEEPPKFVTVEAQALVETLGVSCYEIHPVRWHRIKTYVRKGEIAYPKMYEGGQISDGRHRTLMLMKLYGIKTIQVIETEL